MGKERNRVSLIAKLTAVQAREILRRFKKGERQRDIAIRFRVSQSTVSNIVTRKVYKRNTA